MTRDEWRRAEPLLTKALHLPEADRESLLGTADLEETLRRDLMEILRCSVTGSASVAVAASMPQTPPSPMTPSSPSPLPSSSAAPPAPPAPSSHRRVPALAPGAMLASGRYVIVRQIGRGGMGAVFLGHDTTFGTLVALKVMPYDERVLAEARRAAVCSDHPHVATIHNVLKEQVGDLEIGVLVMEYVAGTPASRLLDDGPVDVARVLKWGQQVAAAIGHAHDHQVVHCDLKPANIVITADGRAKVLDFGISRATFDLADPTEPVHGTIPYMAPEQLLWKQFTPAGDIYSLGVTLFELATGQLPFDGEGDLLRLQIVAAPPPAASELVAEIPQELQKALDRAMAKAPDRRFKSARSFERALSAVEAGVHYTTETIPVPGRTGPSATSLWSKVGIAAVILVITVASITAIGALTSAVFNMTLGRREFVTETMVDWFIWGRRANFTTFVWLIILVVGAMPLMLARQIAVSASSTARRLDAAVTAAVRALRLRLRLDEPSIVAAYFLVVFGGTIAGACAYFWPLLSALMDFVSSAPADKLAILADDEERRSFHSFYRGTFSTIVFGVVAACYAIVSSMRSGRRLHWSLPLGAGAMMIASLVLLHAPYRLVNFRNSFEVVLWHEQRCYVFGERSDKILLFCPESARPRNHAVNPNEAALRRTGATETDPFKHFVQTTESDR